MWKGFSQTSLKKAFFIKQRQAYSRNKSPNKSPLLGPMELRKINENKAL